MSSPDYILFCFLFFVWGIYPIESKLTCNVDELNSHVQTISGGLPWQTKCIMHGLWNANDFKWSPEVCDFMQTIHESYGTFDCMMFHSQLRAWATELQVQNLCEDQKQIVHETQLHIKWIVFVLFYFLVGGLSYYLENVIPNRKKFEEEVAIIIYTMFCFTPMLYISDCSVADFCGWSFMSVFVTASLCAMGQLLTFGLLKELVNEFIKYKTF